MPAVHDQALAIGDVYAQAQLAAANEQGETDEVAEQFADLIAYMDRDPDFARACLQPLIWSWTRIAWAA